MIQETVRRIRELVDCDHLFIVTNAEYAQVIQEQLPELSERNMIIEPEGRNTAPCIGLSALIVEDRDPDAVMAILPADHVILKDREFRRLLQLAERMVLETDGIVTLGIKPDRPETGYGYLETGEAIGGEIYRVARFVEKPNLTMAREYLATGKYLWNGGMFIWKVGTIRRLIRELMPDLNAGLERIRAAMGSGAYESTLSKEYPQFEKISIDYGIMERAPEVYVIPAEIGWDDLGSWSALARWRDQDPQGNTVTGEFIGIDSRKNIVYNPNKLVALLGVDDLIVVETEDCVLVAKREQDQDIREIIAELKRRNLGQYA